MPVREFDGTDDYLTLGAPAGSIALANGPCSIVALIKPLVLTGDYTYISPHRSSGSAPLFEMHDGSGGGTLSHYSITDGTVSGAVGCTASDWQVLGISKPTGTGIFVRMHRKILGSGSWTHIDATADTGSVPTEAWVATVLGRRPSTADHYKNFRIAVAAVFNYELSDANYETVESASTTQAIFDLGPLVLWEFNQASVATAVEDLIGAADETARTGTTVVTGDDPSPWTFGLTGGVVSASDDFTRANSADLGANWTPIDNVGFSISSNTAIPTSYAQDQAEYYSGAWPANQYSQASLTGISGTSVGTGIGVTCRSSTVAANYYRAIVSNAATNNVEVARVDAGAANVLAQRTAAWTSGDILRLEVSGSTLRVLRNGVQLGADITDSTYASGSAGIAYENTLTAGALDNWSGGSLAVAPGSTPVGRGLLMGVG